MSWTRPGTRRRARWSRGCARRLPDHPWRKRLAAFGSAARLAEPAPAADVDRLSRELGVEVPADLRTLLLATDGVTDRYGARLVWPTAEIARQNREFRTTVEFRELYMPFDALLLFGEAGDGDLFFYRILDGAVRNPDVHRWEHETDGRVWCASHLEALLTRALADGS